MGILRDFARGTSIHGLGFIVEPKLPKITRLIWTLLFIGAMIYATLELRLAVICKLMSYDIKYINSIRFQTFSMAMPWVKVELLSPLIVL